MEDCCYSIRLLNKGLKVRFSRTQHSSDSKSKGDVGYLVHLVFGSWFQLPGSTFQSITVVFILFRLGPVILTFASFGKGESTDGYTFVGCPGIDTNLG
jgi:hypothetical protein